MRMRGPLDLLLDGLQIERSALLHRRELDGGLGQLPHLLLDVHEPPKLVDEPVVVVERAGQPRALERIEAEVDKDGHVGLDRAAKPASRLVDEAELAVTKVSPA